MGDGSLQFDSQTQQHFFQHILGIMEYVIKFVLLWTMMGTFVQYDIVKIHEYTSEGEGVQAWCVEGSHEVWSSMVL